MAIVLVISTFEVALIVIKELLNPAKENGLIIDLNELVTIFGFFLNVLIGLELFETVKFYLKENIFHGEVNPDCRPYRHFQESDHSGLFQRRSAHSYCNCFIDCVNLSGLFFNKKNT